MKNKQFQHDCASCEFIGHFVGHDVYVCPQMGRPTVLARRGNEPEAYFSIPIGVLKGLMASTNATVGVSDTIKLPHDEYLASQHCDPFMQAILQGMTLLACKKIDPDQGFFTGQIFEAKEDVELVEDDAEGTFVKVFKGHELVMRQRDPQGEVHRLQYKTDAGEKTMFASDSILYSKFLTQHHKGDEKNPIVCPNCGEYKVNRFKYVEDIGNGRSVLDYDRRSKTLDIESHYETEGYDDGTNERLVCNCGCEFPIPESVQTNFL